MHLKYLRWKAEVPSITSDIIPSKCWPQIQIVFIFHPLKTSKLKKRHLQANFINILLSKIQHIKWRSHGCLSLLILKPESLGCGLLSAVVLLEPAQVFVTLPPPFPSVCSPALPPPLMLRQHKSSDLDKKIIQMKNNPARRVQAIF